MIVRRSASLVARLSSNLCSRNRRSLGSSTAGPAAADAVVPRKAMVSNVANLPPLALDVGGSVVPQWVRKRAKYTDLGSTSRVAQWSCKVRVRYSLP